jgi:pimeloyl-ACP methyl ester carboxylesterase
MKPFLRTKLKARLQRIYTNKGDAINWLFLPGGPGLGSESLALLTQCLELPGTIWHLDLPGDGSNLTKDDTVSFSKWQNALIEAVSILENVVLVAHSTGGMYALSTSGLETKLKGLVLIDSAPNTLWQEAFMHYAQDNPLPKVAQCYSLYEENQSNETLRDLTVASAPYSFTPNFIQQGVALLESLPYNYKTFEWSKHYFDQTYEAKWYPKTIPTLILAGEFDTITPLKFFIESPDFQSENILIREIKNAGHFPWIENPEGVINAFKEYCERFNIGSS